MSMLIPKNNREHVRMTIHVLKDFGIKLTDEERAYIRSLPTEVAVDNYKKKLINEYLGGK